MAEKQSIQGKLKDKSLQQHDVTALGLGGSETPLCFKQIQECKDSLTIG